MFRGDTQGHRGEAGVVGTLDEVLGAGGALKEPESEESAAWQAKWGERTQVPGKVGPGGAGGDLGGLSYEDELELQLASY